jgi:poly[(R)-3-hydroxyalkanoate] polymerase subunit PhaC
MSVIDRIARAPFDAVELANIVLTTDDAVIGATPRDVIWNHRGTTLYRYRSSKRAYPVPLVLVFALINRPDIYDLRPGGSLVEYLLDQGLDVFLLDWGVPAEEDADMGVENYVCDELHWGVREALRASGAEELTLLGWCIGATLCAMYCGLEQPVPVRNLVLLTMPVDGGGSTYGAWIGGEDFDAEQVAERWRVLPGSGVDFANRLLKPVTNFWTTYRRLAESVFQGTARRDVYQSMAKWVGDNPPFPGRVWAQWIDMIYRDGALVQGRMYLRGQRVDLRRIRQSLLVVTAAGDHIAPRAGTMPIFDLVCSEDVTHFDRSGGHIGLMAGSAARKEIWPDLATWLVERSER